MAGPGGGDRIAGRGTEAGAGVPKRSEIKPVDGADGAEPDPAGPDPQPADHDSHNHHYGTFLRGLGPWLRLVLS